MKYIETRYLGTDGKIHTEKIPCGYTPDEYKTVSGTPVDYEEPVYEPVRKEIRTTAPLKRKKLSIIPKKKK